MGQAFTENNGESNLTANNTLTLLSGGDAHLKGTVAQAHRIEADITGNLILASLQDSERYQYRSSNAGGSITIGTKTVSGGINAGTQSINNQFQSVVEQSGLFAGDGGFDIKVGGTTNLTGAAIVSSAPTSLNKIVTNDLAYSDISNRAQTDVSGYSFGLGLGQGSNYITPVPNVGSPNLSSETLSVVSPGTIISTRTVTAADTTNAATLEKQQSTLQTQITDLQNQLVGYPAALSAVTQSKENLAALIATIQATDSRIRLAILRRKVTQERNQLARLQAALVPYQTAESQLAQAKSSLTGTSSEIDRLTGKFATLTSRKLANANPALTNNFDAARTRNTIEVMNVFSETAMRVVGDVYQPRVTDAEKKAAQADAALAAAKAGGTATTISAAQTALDTANSELTSARTQQVIAHGVVGGLTAALGGTNPATGFVGGVAGKTVALTAAELLAKNGIDPVKDPILYNQLLALATSAAGAVTGGSTGGFIASQGDRFNRQLHDSEITYIRKKALAYAKASATPISIEEAERALTRGALYKNDADWAKAYSLYTPDEIAAYQQAADWLISQARLDNFTFINEQGKAQFAFTSSPVQFHDETIFLRDTLSDASNRSFYANRAAVALKDMELQTAIPFVKNGLIGFGKEVPNGVNDALKGYAGLLDDATYARLFSAAQALAADPQATLTRLINGAKGQTQDAALGVYLDWLQKDSKELGGRAGYVTGQTLVDAAAIALGIGVVKNGSKVLDKTADLMGGFKARIVETNSKTLADTSVTWGQGISKQGADWENALAIFMPDGNRLPPGFKTFDFFDPVTGVATSAKTLDTLTPSKIANPSQVYSSLKKNVDAAADFTGWSRGETTLSPNNISTREIQLAVPQGTTVAQWDQINRASQYASSRGVTLKITVVK